MPGGLPSLFKIGHAGKAGFWRNRQRKSIIVAKTTVFAYIPLVSTEIFPRITVNPGVCFGKPTIRGMRIRVSDVLGMLAGGMTADEILADFPYLEREDITAAMAYAAKTTDQRLAFAAE